MKRLIINKENPNGVEVDLTTEEENQFNNSNEQSITNRDAIFSQAEADKEANDALKASAKAKLIAGEALTEEEADTIVL